MKLVSLSVFALLLVPMAASATVYKCEDGGRVVFMDRPCLYAVDAKPGVQPVSNNSTGERVRERPAVVRIPGASEDVALVPLVRTVPR